MVKSFVMVYVSLLMSWKIMWTWCADNADLCAFWCWMTLTKLLLAITLCWFYLLLSSTYMSINVDPFATIANNKIIHTHTHSYTQTSLKHSNNRFRDRQWEMQNQSYFLVENRVYDCNFRPFNSIATHTQFVYIL